MNVLNYSVPSVDGVHDLAGKVYLPDKSPVGILHVLHGMTEHIARYDRFMREMAAALIMPLLSLVSGTCSVI